MNSSDRSIPVVFIAGFGRSGSTLLDRMLGQLEGAVSCGELYYIWHRSLSDNQLCGCSKNFHECPFWQDVMENAFGTINRFDLESFLDLRKYIHAKRHIPYLLFPFLRTDKFQVKLTVYTNVINRLYRAILDVSGAEFVIDSSKNPLYAFALKSSPSIDLRLVHLVRDSRAVAYSWQKKIVRPEVQRTKTYMHRYTMLSSAVEWTSKNLLVHILSSQCEGSFRVLYEGLITAPHLTFDQLVKTVAGLDYQLNFLDKDEIKFAVDHTVSGNPNRLKNGITRLTLDEEWRKRFSFSSYCLVTGLTFPLLAYYGYFSQTSKHNTRRFWNICRTD